MTIKFIDEPEVKSGGVKFIDEASSFDVSSIKSDNLLNSVNGNNEGAWDKVKYYAEESKRTAARGTFGSFEGFGGVLQFMGENLNIDFFKKQLMKDPTIKAISAPLSKVVNGKQITDNSGLVMADLYGSKMQKVGETISKVYGKAARIEGLEPVKPEVFAGEFLENPSWSRGFQAVVGAVPSLGIAAAATAVSGNPLVGMSILSGMESGDVFLEAKEKGKTQEERGTVTSAVFAGTFGLEKFSAIGKGLFGKNVKGISGKIVNGINGAWSEGWTEGGQQLWANLVRKVGVDETTSLMEGVVESMIGGAGSGGALSFSTSTSRNNYKNTIDNALKNGATQEELDTFSEEIGRSMALNNTEVNQLLDENIDKTLQAMEEVEARVIPQEIVDRFAVASITEDTVRVELNPEERAQLQLAGIEGTEDGVFEVKDIESVVGSDVLLKTKTQQIVEKLRKGDVKDLSEQDIDDVKNMIANFRLRPPKQPQDFLQVLRRKGGLDLDIAKALGLKDEAGFKGVLRKGGIKEDSLTELVKEFTGREVDSVEAFDFLRESIHTPAFSIEDQIIIEERESILRNLDFIAQEIGGDVKGLSDIVNQVERLNEIGFTDRASEELIKKQLQIKLLKSKGVDLESLTKQNVKDLQTEITNIISDLPIEAKNKAKFLKTIKNVNTPIQFRNAYNDILRRAENFYKSEIKNKHSETIQKELRKSRDKSVSQVRKGKYDYTTNKVFKDLREFDKLTKEQAFEEFTKLQQMPAKDKGDEIRQRFLSMKALGKKDGSPELFEQVFNDIKELERIGKESTDLKDFLGKMEKVSEIEEVKTAMDKLKPTNKIGKIFDKTLGDWKTFMNSLGGKKFADKYNFINSQKNQQVQVQNKTEQVTQFVIDSYGVKHNQSAYQMAELTNDNTYELEYLDKTLGKVNLNRSNLISVYNLIKNDNIRQRYYDTFGQLQVDNILNNLTSQDTDFGNSLTEFLEDYYPEVNKVFVELNNTDLPQVESYFPSKSEYQTYEDIFSDYVGQSSIPSAFKSRAQGKVIPNPKIDAYGAVIKYINQAEYVKNVGLQHKKINNIFKDVGVKNKIVNKFGEKYYKNILSKLDSLTLDGAQKQLDAVSGMYNKVLGNWTGAKVGLNPAVMAKQLISTINFSEKMPTATFSKHLLQGIAQPSKTIKFMMDNSQYLQTRYKKGGSDVMVRMMQNAEEDVSKLGLWANKNLKYNEITMKQYISATQRAGDIAAWIYGGNAKVKYLMSKEGGGLSLKEAFTRMENEGLEAQQSSLTSQMADVQNAGGAYKIFTQFKNTQLQYYRLMRNATAQRMRGEISKTEYAKTMSIYGVINPAIYGYIGYLFGAGIWKALGADSDRDPARDMFFAVASNSMNAVPFFGQLWDSALRASINDFSFDPSIPVINDLYDSFTGYGGEWELDAKDLIETLVETSFGLPVKTWDRYVTKATQ